MIEVRVPKEITEYREKIIFGMSFRQLIFAIPAMLLGITTGFFLTKKIGVSLISASYPIFFVTVPLWALGFIRVNGFPFEKYLALVARHKFGKQKRSYGTKLLMDYDTHTNLKDEKISMEGDSEKKHAKFFKTKKKFKRRENIKEATIFISDRKARKAKRKKSLQQIKKARKEYRQAK